MLDIDKLNKAQEGDLKCIEEICTETWEPLYRYIYFKVQNREEAEDITQETYVKALSYLQKNSIGVDKYIAFLKTVALNILRDKWRKNKRRGIRVNMESVNPSQLCAQDDTEACTQRIAIEKMLSELSEQQQKVIELRIINGFSVSETAKIMNKKEGTVRVLQYRALQNLCRYFKE